MAAESHAMWSADRIMAETFVAEVEIHGTGVSTNDRALELAANAETVCPLLILADRQEQGRGRGQNKWWSASGALTFSLLLQPDPLRLPQSRWPEMSLTVGTSICAALARKLPEEPVQLKWPNDVYLRGAKVSGVLVEVSSQPCPRVVIGIGLNVNNSLRTAPVELQSKLIALCDVRAGCDPQSVLIDVLRELEQQLNLLSQSPEEIRGMWRRFDLLGRRTVILADGTARIAGKCTGIGDDGALLLQTEDELRRCYSGVIEHWE